VEARSSSTRSRRGPWRGTRSGSEPPGADRVPAAGVRPGLGALPRGLLPPRLHRVGARVGEHLGLSPTSRAPRRADRQERAAAVHRPVRRRLDHAGRAQWMNSEANRPLPADYLAQDVVAFRAIAPSAPSPARTAAPRWAEQRRLRGAG